MRQRFIFNLLPNYNFYMILRGDFFSKELQMETSLTVLIPNNAHVGENYKVVYLLHGICGKSGDWINYTMLPTYAENYNAAFVMPEVARSFYANMKYGLKYFDYITKELPVLCKSVFNISGQRNDTAIIGASMGGYGALKCALTYPEQYGYCCAFSSPCLFLKEDLEKSEGAKNFKSMYGEDLFRDFQAAFGEDIAYNSDNDVLALAQQIIPSKNTPNLYLACGTDDFFYYQNQRFSDEIKNLNFNHTFDAWGGKHDWYFINDALKKGLEFCF